MTKKVQLTIPNFPAIFLIGGIVVLFYFLYILYTPFITVLILAIFFATIFYTLFKKLRKLFGGRSRLASVVTCFIALLVIAIPLSGLVTLLVLEGLATFQDILQKVQEGFFQSYFNWQEGNYFYDQFQNLLFYVNENISNFGFESIDIDLIRNISESLSSLGATLAGYLTNFIGNIFWFILSVIIFFFALYYFLKDGEMIVQKMGELSPLPKKHNKAIFKKFKEVSLAMIFGIFFTAIIQGGLAGIGYAVAGIPNPIFWAAATAVFSLVPLLGTAIIWVPASMILFVTGNYVEGIGLFLWGVLIVGTVDNFVRPYLIEGRAPVHPLLTFLAVLGGVFVFGLKGIIFGPIILNLLLAFLHIYQMEYSKVLNNN